MQGFDSGGTFEGMLAIRPDVLEDVIEALGALARDVPDLEHDVARIETLSELSVEVGPTLTDLSQISGALGQHMRWILESMMQFDISYSLPFPPSPHRSVLAPEHGHAREGRVLPGVADTDALVQEFVRLAERVELSGPHSVEAAELDRLQELLAPLSWRERAFLLALLVDHRGDAEVAVQFFDAVAAVPSLFSSHLVQPAASRALGLPTGSRFDPATALNAIDEGQTYPEVELRQEHLALLTRHDRFLNPAELRAKRVVQRALAAENGFTPPSGSSLGPRTARRGEAGGTGDWAPRGLHLPPADDGDAPMTSTQQGTVLLQGRLREMSADAGVIFEDEFGVTVHGNGNVTIVLPGVSSWGLSSENETPRRGSTGLSSYLPQDRLGLGSGLDDLVGDSGPGRDVQANIYAQQVVAAIETAIERGVIDRGAPTLLVGHSLGGDTAVDLAQDDFFRSLVTPSFVVSFAYANDRQACDIPADATLLTINNQLDGVVIFEDLAEIDLLSASCVDPSVGQAEVVPNVLEAATRRSVSETVDGVGAAVGWVADQLGQPIAIPSVRPTVAPTATTWRADNSLAVTFIGNGPSGHALEEYVDGLDQLTAGTGGSDGATRVIQEIADAGFASAGITFGVDGSSPLNAAQLAGGWVADTARDWVAGESDDD